MTILLTGCGGQLGSALAAGLARFGPLVTTDLDTLDLADAQSLRAALDRWRPTLIVNTAAYTDVEGAEDDKATARAVNATAPAALAAWAAANGAALLHYSTDYVYDGVGDTPRQEDAGLGPLNEYGRSKLDGDRAVRESGAAVLILRTSWLYAAAGRNFLFTMLRLGAERRALQVVDDQIGAPTSARLLAEITLAILAQSEGNPAALFRRVGGVVHAAASGETSWHGFATAIFEEARARGFPIAVERVDAIRSAGYRSRAARPLNSRLSLERLYQRFGIVPQGWREALAAEMDILSRRDGGLQAGDASPRPQERSR
ncbi:MAG: dTDP-4-dehydrorhamnose reductase [Alphaproteobacteria bacterium]